MPEPMCPKCKGKMYLRNGQNGEFWGCGSYPACRGTVPKEGAPTAPPVATPAPPVASSPTAPQEEPTIMEMLTAIIATQTAMKHTLQQLVTAQKLDGPAEGQTSMENWNT